MSFILTPTGNAKIKVKGNIENLLDYQTVANDGHPNAAENCFYELFSYAPIIEAPDIKMTTIPAYGCYSMFSYCSSLTKAPKLPATNLNICCYYEMFSYCSSLTEAPELPATALAESCYQGMFIYTALTSTPALPATIMQTQCYYEMFVHCTSLTKVTSLTINTSAAACCYHMFMQCSSLSDISNVSLLATTLLHNCYAGMFGGTAITTPPKISATTLANWCCSYMFGDCKSLTTLPKLKATGQIPSSAYKQMFDGCTNIKLSTSQTGNYQYSFRIPQTGSNTTYDSTSVEYMFRNTGGTFTGTPSVNTTYYTDHEPIGD